ncbi:MAG: hypothetical protein JNM47_04145 [Hyphomonadaceae bacterium]|nr:hypothetical protein [Hyphomonadaceae bacterium]
MLKLWGVLAVAMILCVILSNLVGDWLLAVWFVGAILTASLYVYGNTPPTYLFVGLALAWTYIMLFTDLIAPR